MPYGSGIWRPIIPTWRPCAPTLARSMRRKSATRSRAAAAHLAREPRKSLGERHPDFIKSLLLMGELLKETGRSDEAEKQFQRALTLRRDAIREVSIYFATNRNKVDNASTIAFGGERADDLTVGYANVWIPEQSAPNQRLASRPSSNPDETTAMTRLVDQEHDLEEGGRAGAGDRAAAAEFRALSRSGADIRARLQRLVRQRLMPSGSNRL